MYKRILKVSGLTVVLFSLTSCFSTYPIQKKFPCEETTTQEKLNIIESAYNSKMKPKKLDVTETGVSIGKRSYEFNNIRYVRVKTKRSFLFIFRKYWIQIREFNRDMNEIYLRDPAMVESVNNAIMCLTNLHETNGRPSKNTTPKLSKYDELEKLKELLDSGAISQDEYDKEKEKILNK